LRKKVVGHAVDVARAGHAREKQTKENKLKTVKTVCHRDCPDTCFIDVTVEKGKIVNTKGSRENPITAGFLCPRGNKDIERVYSPERVLYPHVRSSSAYSRVTWDAALHSIADCIRSTLAQHGRKAVLLYDYPGNTGLLAWHFPKRLWSALGATTTDYALCSRSGHTGIGLHYGQSYGLSLEEVAASGLILFWGHNAKISAPHIWALARRAKKDHGAFIASVDSRKSPTAQAADLWVQPRPGSDVALCYGIARHLIAAKGIDLEFIYRHTTGFEAYAEATNGWTSQKVQQATGLDDEKIARFAELLMDRQPAAFMIGFGLQKSLQGAEAARAVSLLPALRGRHRRFHYSNGAAARIDWPMITGSGLTDKPGEAVSQVEIGRKLAAGDFKFIYVTGSNPASTLPDQQAVRDGLARDDVFLVVHDTHWSETAKHAAVVLPAPTFLEKRDLTIPDHHSYCRLSEKAIEPLGESRPETWVMQQLAKRLGREEAWLREDPWTAVAKALRNTFQEGTVEDLLAGKARRLKPRSRQSYQTASGKIAFAAENPPDGAAPLPTQHTLPDAKKGFVLLNSATANYTHSQFADVYGPIPSIVWIHPRDAERISIEEDDVVAVANDHGTVTLHARITDKVLPGTLWAPRPLIGLNGVGLNTLVRGVSQQIGGGPLFNSVKVTLCPARQIGKP
jgi:anaerobic selenocysteine-containing dehydrogenase